MAKRNASLEGEFKHNTSIGQNGEILYDCPIEINDKADLNNYHITWDDCRTISFNGSDPRTVYFFKTENRALAEYMWDCIDTEHSSEYRSTRCWILGKRKTWIRCPDTNSCANCPNKDNRMPPFVSRDAMIDAGYEPATTESVEETVCTKLELDEIKVHLDSVDTRLYEAASLRWDLGLPVKCIAEKMLVSEPRVYQMLAQVKALAKAYREENW